MMEERRRLLAARRRPATPFNPEMCGRGRLISGQPVKGGEVRSETATVGALTPSSTRAKKAIVLQVFLLYCYLSFEVFESNFDLLM